MQNSDKSGIARLQLCWMLMMKFYTSDEDLGGMKFGDGGEDLEDIIGYTFFATSKRRKDSDTLCRTESLAQIANSQ